MAMDKNKGSSKRVLSPSPFESPAENRARKQREELAKKFKALQSPTPKKKPSSPPPLKKAAPKKK